MLFQYWLKSRGRTEDALQLIHYLKENKILFPEQEETFEALASQIDASKAEASVKTELKTRAKKLWAQFKAEPVAHPELRYWLGKILTRDVALCGIVVFLIWTVASSISNDSNILSQLADVKTARGLITFIFALGTIGTALVITISVFTSNRLPEESKERFYRAKEILTILIGIHSRPGRDIKPFRTPCLPGQTHCR
ncbi:MAG: hypothetical protein HUN05_04265 [Desulfobacter sp.]|nr:MAG: hypothetical protein HUN05_04265 [Desulfobacter sp.]